MKGVATLVALIIFASLLGPLSAFAAGTPYTPTLSIRLDKSVYSGDDSIAVRGTYWPNMGPPVVVEIRSPTGSHTFMQTAYMEDDNSEYTASFLTGGPEWVESGSYLVTALWNTSVGDVSNRTSFLYNSTRAVASQTTSTLQSNQNSASATAVSSTEGSKGFALRNSALLIGLVIVAAVVALVAGTIGVRRRSNR